MISISPSFTIFISQQFTAHLLRKINNMMMMMMMMMMIIMIMIRALWYEGGGGSNKGVSFFPLFERSWF
jgi:hypothetical protein